MKPMDLQHAITHHRRLIKEITWLEEGMAWTVILPLSEGLSLQETATVGAEIDPGGFFCHLCLRTRPNLHRRRHPPQCTEG
jgi:hypothetical protein